MYTIEVHARWSGSDYGWDGYPEYYYIVRDSDGDIIFENDWQDGFTNEGFVANFMEMMFGDVQYTIEGDI